MALSIPMPDPSPLKDPLRGLARQPLSQHCKVALLSGFWGASAPIVDWSKTPVDIYFKYFEHQCRLALHDWDRYDISSLTFDHVVKIGESVHEGKARAEIDTELKTTTSGDCPDLSIEIVDLAVRLLSMTQIGGFRNAFMPVQETLPWSDGTLSDALNQHFTRDNILKETVELERTFTARNIERIAGIRIVWTNNLLDHLRLRDDDTSVAVFHHASFLNFQKESNLFPDGLVEETIKTLSLLLPLTDRETTTWFLKQQIELHLDSEAVRCKSLTKESRNIDTFEFWRDRLVCLKQAFDRAEPSNLKQAWADRRNRSQWYNFWVAGFLILGLTILLALVQCVLGALQVYKAYHPT